MKIPFVLAIYLALFSLPSHSHDELQVESCETFCDGPADRFDVEVIPFYEGGKRYVKSVGSLFDQEGHIIAESIVEKMAELNVVGIGQRSLELKLREKMALAAKGKKFLCEKGWGNIFVSQTDVTDGCSFRPFAPKF